MENDNINNYFPHDSNARNSDKIIRLRMRHKAAGYGVYFMILERLREEKNYMSIKDYNIIAFDLREDASLIKSVIEDFGLFVFTEDGKYFYSESFKHRMELKDAKKLKRSEAGKKGMAKRWKDNNAITMLPQDDSNVITNPQKPITSKGKKSKVESSKEDTTNVVSKKDAAIAATLARKESFKESLDPYRETYGESMIQEFFEYWTEMNKSQSKMRFEQQKTWETPRRLKTWANRENNFKNKSYGNSTNTASTAGSKLDEDFFRSIAEGCARGNFQREQRGEY